MFSRLIVDDTAILLNANSVQNLQTKINDELSIEFQVGCLRVYKHPVASPIYGDTLTTAFFANRSFNNIVTYLVQNKYITLTERRNK